MARSTQHEWFSFRRDFSRRAPQPRSTKRQPLRRRLRFEPLEDRRLLALVTVDTLGDTVDFTDGVTSLREAIFATNLVGGADTIEFAASLTSSGPATITLTQGASVKITDALAINGPGADLLTIDASGNDPTPDSTFDDDDLTNDGDGRRVFTIDDGKLDRQIEVSISGLTLTGGDVTGGGGAIDSRENLTVTHSTISGNLAGFVGGYATMGPGGGIFSAYGSLTVTDSTISGNSADGGGGIFSNYGNLTVTGSTISGNSARFFSGGGIGGIWGGNVTVTDSTISGNSAAHLGGGIYSGNVSVTDSTISGNSAGGDGGGIYSSGSLLLDHSIVAQNTGPNGDINGPGGTTAQYSLVGNNQGSGLAPAPVGSPDANGNFIGTPGVPINPLLGPLVDNGGPTMTHALLAGSPALDAGDSAIVFNPAEHDQRGAPFVRVFDGDGAGGARIDIGAYERQTVAGLNLVVDTTVDEHDGDYSAGDLSLREAIDLAHGFVGADEITFAAALSGATITLGGTELSISEALVIDARPLAANVTVDANELSRIFNITATTGDFTISGLTLSGGRTTGNNPNYSDTTFSGGAIRSLTTGNLTLDQSTISGNSTAGSNAWGGGIWAFNSVTLTQSTVSGNSTSGNSAFGGGIFSGYRGGWYGTGIFSGAVTLTQSTVSGNSTAGEYARGGGIITGGAVELTQSTVSGNSTAGIHGYGGGIFADGSVTLTQSTVSGNSTAEYGASGGGIYAGTVTLTQSTVSGNSTAGVGARGGGINAYGDVTLSQSTVNGNSTAGARAYGGGINARGGVTLTQSTVSGNSTAEYGASGGGIYAGTVTLTQSTVSGNSTTGYLAHGGGIFSNGAVTLTQSTVSGNSTTGYFAHGGGIITAFGGVTLTESIVSGNSTAGARAIGGGIIARYGVTLTRSTVSGNSTAGDFADGGGIRAGGAVTVTQSTVTDNHAMHATATGGGVFQFNSGFNNPFTISGSIVAGNTAGGSGADLVNDPQSSLTVNYSLIGTGITPTAGGNNVVTNNPHLGPLANNGGPTQTHAPLAGSPAIDAGDPRIVFNPAEYDQRGAPFGRVFDGDSNGVARIEIGAYESQPDGTLGDYNRDGGVNAADYVMWRKFLGTSVAPPFTGADGDGDSSVDPDDYDVWQENFGEALPGVGSGAAPELIAPRIQFVEHAEAAATDSNLPHVETDAAAARTSSFAAFGTRSHRPNSTSKTVRRPINQHRLAESRADDLLLLAIDCIGRSPQQALVVHDHEENDEHHADNDIKSQIDESLAVALAERQ